MAVREAVAEIQRAARRDPVLAGEGAVLFLEKVAPAIRNVDGSSGSMGFAVNNAVEDLVAVIAAAPAEDPLRRSWLERLWQAIQDDRIPYLETLGTYWDELCVKPEIGAAWADRLGELVALDPEFGRGPPGYGSAMHMLLGGMLRAGRTAEILEAIENGSKHLRCRRQWGVKALAAQGKVDEALAYAHRRSEQRSYYDGPALCEKILIDAGRVEEAYQTYGLHVRTGASYLNAFRAIVKKYPGKEPATILRDLIQRSGGDDGRWFATAKSLGLLDLALELAKRFPCDPMTLAKAARDFAAENPAFALEVGLASVRWLLAGNYYEVAGIDVYDALDHILGAARSLGKEEEALRRLRELLDSPGAVDMRAKGFIDSTLSMITRGPWFSEKLLERARKSRGGRWSSGVPRRNRWEGFVDDVEIE
jgi:hypothetical protein